MWARILRRSRIKGVTPFAILSRGLNVPSEVLKKQDIVHFLTEVTKNRDRPEKFSGS
jgi:hypothetical protein